MSNVSDKCETNEQTTVYLRVYLINVDVWYKLRNYFPF